MSDFDVNNLLNALENNENESILSKNLTSEKIDIIKNNVFDDIGIDDETRDDLKKKLQKYIYIDGMNDLIPGSYIRWIPLQNPDNIHLTRGGNICDINICEKGTTVVVKNLRNNYMQLCLDNCLIFRKLNNQEMILISAMNYLQNN